MFDNIGVGEILVIALVALIVFGPQKLPDLLQGLGKGIRQFKNAMNDVEEEIKDSINVKPDNKEKKD
jgi:sec-independent protein translocase protein TatA